MNTPKLFSNTRTLGTACMLAASLCFSTGGLLMKLIPWNPLAINGARNLIACHTAGISIHPPLAGSDYRQLSIAITSINFNPRPLAGSDFFFLAILFPYLISIHAPSRGATEREQAYLDTMRFQSTPPSRGATSLPIGSSSVVTHFNPRPPRGERRNL